MIEDEKVYLNVEISADLLKQFKAKAALNGITLREFITRIMKFELNKDQTKLDKYIV